MMMGSFDSLYGMGGVPSMLDGMGQSPMASADPSGQPSMPQGSMTPMQRMMLARTLMGTHVPQQQMPMLSLGDVQGNLPGGGVMSPYGTV